MISTRQLGIFVGCLLLAAAAQAQPAMQPGLWENSVQMSSPNGEMDKAMQRAQAAMAKMPPEQRKQMEAMMAKQGVAMGDSPNAVRVCISKEQAELRQLPAARPGCTQTMQHSGNQVQMTFSCAGTPPSSGQGQVTFRSPTAYDGDFTFTTERQGKPSVMQMKQSAKWLSADCGGLKPMAAPQTK